MRRRSFIKTGALAALSLDGLGGLSGLSGVFGGGGAPLNSAEAQQFFDRLLTPPVGARKTLYSDMIDSLVANGCWAKILMLCVAATDAATTLINLKSSSFQAISVQASFLQDRGYVRGAAPTNVVNAVINLSTDAAQNDVSLFSWNLTNAGSTVQPAVATSGLEASGDSEIWQYNTTNVLHMLNSASEPNFTTPAALDGLWLLNRTASNLLTLDRNGAQVFSSANISAAPKNLPLQWARNVAQRIAVFGVASSLTTGERAALYTSLYSFVHGIGAV